VRLILEFGNSKIGKLIPIVDDDITLGTRTGAANALTPGDLFVAETIALFPNSPKGFG
jgi:hypothetical protein